MLINPVIVRLRRFAVAVGRLVRKRPWVAAGLAVVVLAAAVLTPVLSSSGEGPSRRPFLAAADALESAPGVRLVTTLGSGRMDVRTLRSGESTGTFRVGSVTAQVLSVDGRAFLRLAGGVPPGVPAGSPIKALTGRWLTGTATATSASGGSQSPERLAASVRSAANAGDLRITTGRLNGRAVLVGAAADSTITVTAAAPYRLLRVVRRSPGARTTTGGGLPKLPAPPAPPTFSLPPLPPAPPAIPGVYRRSNAAAQPIAAAATTSGTVDVEQLSTADVASTYSDLRRTVPQLADAVDLSYQFDATGASSIQACAPSGCTVAMNVRNTFAAANLNASTITVDLTASLTANGAPVGSCAATTTMPVNGSTTVSCAVESPLAEAIYGEARALAEEESAATREPVPFVVTFVAQINALVHGVASADIAKIQKRLDDELESFCGTPNSFPAGTRVLMADGTTQPIERVRPGDSVLAAGVADARPAPTTVVAVVVGTEPEPAVRITVGARGPPASVGATAHHPFATAGGWVDAGDLQPGSALVGRPGATVRANSPAGAVGPVYDLTVAGAHTFYVAAGPYSLLVHNTPPDGCPEESPTPSPLPTRTSIPGLILSRKQLESKFKHADVFGVTKPRGASGFDAFGKALAAFVDSPSTTRVLGTYRGNPVILNYNATSELMVVQSPDGTFVSGWRMTEEQLEGVLMRRSLGGGG